MPFERFWGCATRGSSREIVVFGLFAALACLYAGVVVAPEAWPMPREMIRLLAYDVVVVGAVAVLCSVMIYASVRREFWDFPRTVVRFALTSVLLGLATLWLSLAALALIRPSETSVALMGASGPTICWTLMIVACAKLGWEATVFRHLLSRTMTPLKRSALLMIRDLANLTVARFALGTLGGIFVPALLFRHSRPDPSKAGNSNWRLRRSCSLEDLGRRTAGAIPVLCRGCGAAVPGGIR